MDAQCQDEFPHCTDPGLEQERINVTFRWFRQYVAFPVLAQRQGWRVVCQRVRRVHPFLLRSSWERRFGELRGAPGGFCARWRYQLCWFTPSCLQDPGYAGVPIAGHAQWAEVGGSILPGVHWFPLKCAWKIGGGVRQTSLSYLQLLSPL